jgi:hypothetical protein
MKAKVIYVTRCGDCPFFSIMTVERMLATWTQKQCERTKTEILDPTKRLSTCPLQDYDGPAREYNFYTDKWEIVAKEE